MSYDINVFLNKVNDEITSEWEKKLNDFGFDCEIHPEFSFSDQTGFLPIKYLLKSDIIPGYKGRELLSGFEMYIDDFDTDFYESEDCTEEIKSILRNARKSIIITISSQDSMEFTLGILSSAILSDLLDGGVYDPQEGSYYTRENVYKYALTMMNEDHKYLNEHGWKLHDFNGWS